MNFENYCNRDKFPSFISKPKLKAKATSQDAVKYAQELEIYEKQLEEIKEKRINWQTKQNELNKKFKEDLLNEFNLTNHPKANEIFMFAWEKGHSNGYYAVHDWVQELVDKEII